MDSLLMLPTLPKSVNECSGPLNKVNELCKCSKHAWMADGENLKAKKILVMNVFYLERKCDRDGKYV